MYVDGCKAFGLTRPEYVMMSKLPVGVGWLGRLLNFIVFPLLILKSSRGNFVNDAINLDIFE